MKSDNLVYKVIKLLVLIYCCPHTSAWATPRPVRQISNCKANTECVNIRKCKNIVDRLQNKEQDPSIIDDVRKWTCGFEGRDPKICCPTNSGFVRPPPYQPPNPETTNKYPSAFDLKKYPKLRGQENCGKTEGLPNRIVGGRNASLGAWPWMTALGYRDSRRQNRPPLWLCGGALVSTTHVITAAHCIKQVGVWQLYWARMGDLNLDPTETDGATPVDIAIAETIVHPKYEASSFTNDIAIVRLSKQVQFTNLIRPICLPFPPSIRENALVGYEPYVAGWGSTAHRGPSSNALQEVQVPVVSIKECKKQYEAVPSAVIDQRVLCAGYRDGGKDSCQGDSGGPLMHWKISSVCHTHQLNQLLGFVLLCFLDLPLISPTIWNFGSSSQSSDSQPSRIDARATDPNSCTNPRNEQGTCINIRRCDSMIELLKKSRQDPSAVEFLRKASCGYEGRDPKVCCADSISSNGGWGGGSTTQSPPFSTNSNRRGTTTQSPPRNPDRRTNRPTFPTTAVPNPGNRGNGNTGSNGRYTNLPGQDRCGTSKATQANRIVGGQPADLGAWPWMVALGYRKLTSLSNKPNWLCGGALISTRHVLTAAHCISARSDVQLYVVRLGELDLNPDVKDGASPVDIQIAEKIAHPAFNSSTFVNDIGILRLQTPASFTDYIQPICLPFPPAVRDNSFVNYEPFVAGWGTTASNGPASTALRQVQIPVVDNEECKDNYKNIKTAVIDKRVMCAGLAMGGKDSCQGDSGGPLMLPQGLTFYQIGVVSYGKKCAEPGYPGVYTRVSQFLDWIEQTAK